MAQQALLFPFVPKCRVMCSKASACEGLAASLSPQYYLGPAVSYLRNALTLLPEIGSLCSYMLWVQQCTHMPVGLADFCVRLTTGGGLPSLLPRRRLPYRAAAFAERR